MILENRSLPRAKYLYKRIKAGRVSRQYQFNMLICQQLDIVHRKAEFFSCCKCKQTRKQKPEEKAVDCLPWKKNQRKCIVCKEEFLEKEGKIYDLTHNGERKQVTICPDCKNDAM